MLEEVMVTAERFSSTVQSTPVAVTAISAESLAEHNVTNVLQAAEEIPGIVIVPAGSSSSTARIVLRGAGQSQGGIRSSSTVGIYIDNVIQPRATGAFFDFFDIAALEVLRGPQGTLYGRNTSGGAIKIQTKRPSFDWTGATELGVGNYDNREGKVYVSGPLVENKLAFSASGAMRKRDGFIYGLEYGERIGDVDRSDERVKLLFTPTDNLEIDLSVYAMQDYSEIGVGIPLTVLPGVDDPYAVPGRDLTLVETFGPLSSRINNTGASINATYTASAAVQVNSITGYGNQRISSQGSSIHLTPRLIAANNGQLYVGTGGVDRSQSEFYTQEVNAIYSTERLKAVVGAYYFYEKGVARGADPTGPVSDAEQETEAPAIFGQATYTLGHGVSITGGLRYTRETQNYYSFDFGSVQGPQVGKATFSATTPKLGLSWQITPDLLTYASWTQGYRAGGFNPRDPNTNLFIPTPYGSENVDSYEAGVKFTSADHRFRLNVAVYQAEYEGLHLPVFFPSSSRLFTVNASGADIRGIEFEPTWQVLDTLQLYGNMSFTHGEYTEPFRCSGEFNQITECSDKLIKGLIPEKIVAGFRYSPQLPIRGEVRITGSWHYTDAYENNTSNDGPLTRTQAVDLYNASLGWAADDGRWNVTLDGRNLANKHYVLSSVQLSNATQPAVTGFINEPRRVMLRLGVNF